MNPALALMAIYVVTTGILQFVGFLISRAVESLAPSLGLMTFLVLYLGMFWLAWPVAVRLAETFVPGAKTAS
jgi:hypothetical protein